MFVLWNVLPFIRGKAAWHLFFSIEKRLAPTTSLILKCTSAIRLVLKCALDMLCLQIDLQMHRTWLYPVTSRNPRAPFRHSQCWRFVCQFYRVAYLTSWCCFRFCSAFKPPVCFHAQQRYKKTNRKAIKHADCLWAVSDPFFDHMGFSSLL